VPVDINELNKESSASARMLRFIEDYQPGFVIYFGDQISTTSARLARETIYSSFEETDYLPLLAVDHEGGLVQRFSGEGFTRLESCQKVVDNYSSELQKAVYTQAARELEAVGVNIVFAPVVDLASNSAVLKTRAAADLNKTYTAASNLILSYSQNGVMPVLKHFPGIGSISSDPHRVVSTISLRKDDTEIFSKLLNKFKNIGLMTTHVRLQDKLADQVCSLSAECLSKLTTTYPEVLLFTDDLTMKAALVQGESSQEKSLGQVAVEAIQAGNNVLVFGKGVDAAALEEVTIALLKEYNDSESFKTKVNNSASKILSFKK
jgi:beta-N-acetylhexosaminidase